eukprot:10927487-Ditylum_brightwellii.AAC.1
MIIQKDQTKHELSAYLHACAFSPSLCIFQNAICKGNVITWPGIKNINFEKEIKETTAIAKGHMDQEHQNLQSIKKQQIDYDDDTFPMDGI